MNDDFDFMTDNAEKEEKTTTSGSPESITLQDVEKAKEILGLNLKEKKTATSGSPNVITAEIRTEAKKLAESSKGLDIAAFQRKYHIYVMNVAELLEG